MRAFALRLFEQGLVHNVASDAHDHANRAPGMAGEIERAGLGALAGWLTEEVPAAILAGAAEVPQRPPFDTSGLRPRRAWRAPWHRR